MSIIVIFLYFFFHSYTDLNDFLFLSMPNQTCHSYFHFHSYSQSHSHKIILATKWDLNDLTEKRKTKRFLIRAAMD